MPPDPVVHPSGMPDALDRAAFIDRFGPVFEHSPWVAEAAWERRPFARLEAVHRAMVGVVRAAPRERQLALLRAHPELWGREARERRMTADSVAEQAAAGLFSLSAEAAARIERLNAEHQQKFGFPFIIAVMKHDREAILAEFERRLGLDAEAAFEAALGQVEVITGLRMARRASERGTAPGATK